MNNPVIQKNELFREAPYYRGCYKTYWRWYHYWRITGREEEIPMKQFNLIWEWAKEKGWDSDPFDLPESEKKDILQKLEASPPIGK